jgi:pyruvate dehydrogenase E2 component (dihydrolipoamide acetyltransferase)
MTDILMPRLTDQMEEGTIVAWLVDDGATVAEGQEVVEIETDKATMAHPAEAAGVLQIVAREGDAVPVGELIARVGVAGANASDAPPAAPPDTAADAQPPEPSEAPAVDPEPVVTRGGNGNGNANGDGRLVTPLARRIAAAHGVALGDVSGSGPGGRVVKRDVLAAAGITLAPEPEVEPEPAPAAAAPSPSAPAPEGSSIQQPTRLQQIVAKRMLEATQTVPHFQVQTEVEIDGALALRAQLKAAGEGVPVPSVNDLIVKACALNLPKHPLVNGSFKDGAFELHDGVHVGIAVASDEGLVVATVRDADVKSLGAIAGDARGLAERVRTGKATPADLSGATFTVSNLGMFGMTAITAVINPPQAAILGVGAARDTLARGSDGEIVDRKLLTLTLSCDHRILNGADGSRFLFDVKHTLENPMRLAL